MKDFYGRRRQGKEPNRLPRILSAASSKEGVSQQARRFKNGPQGLQEMSKKRRTRTPTQKRENSTPLNATCIDAPRIAHTTSSPHYLSAQAEDGEDDPFTFSGNCASQSPHCSGGVRPAQGDASALNSRDHLIGSDPLAFVSVSVDPFDTLPLPNCPRTQILIYHGQ